MKKKAKKQKEHGYNNNGVARYINGYMNRNDAIMMLNENHNNATGGFKWEFLDYKPKDIKNYAPVTVIIGVTRK